MIWRRGHKRRDPWAAVARALQLEVRPDGRGVQGRTLELDVSIGLNTNDCVDVELTLRPLVLAAMGEPALALQSRGEREGDEGIFTGDAGFDARVLLRGREEMISACMGREGRRRVLAFAETGGTLHDGTFRLATGEPATTSTGILRAARLAVEAAAAVLAFDFPPALETNAAADPVLGVRLRNLQLLDLHYPNSLQRERAVERALGDREPELVLAGARLAPETTWPRLVGIVENPRQGSRLRCAIFEHLIANREHAAATHLLLTALRADDTQLRYAGVIAFVWFAEHSPAIAGDDSVHRALLQAMSPELVAKLAKNVAVALGSDDNAGAEPLLISLLDHELQEVRIRAAASLARIGTLRAVEPLLALSRKGPLQRRTNLAALEAMRAIQARLGDADAGRVSLATDDSREGAVSIAEGEGAVSLARDPALG